MILLFIIIFFVCALVYFYITLNQNYWKKRNVPFIEAKWFFGNYKEILFANRHLGVVFQDMYNRFCSVCDCSQQPDALYSGYLKIRQPCVLVRHPDLVKTVLTKDFSSFADNDIHIDKEVDFLFGNNPFVLNGEEWKQARNHFIPTTMSVRLKTYFPGMLSVCETMCKYVEGQTGDNGLAHLEAKLLGGTYTTDVIANAVFGVETNSFENPDNPFARITRSIFENTFIHNFLIMTSFIFPQLMRILRIRFVSKECEDLLMSLTKKVLKHRLQTGEVRNDFFQQMIQYRQNDRLGVFTDKYIAAHCFGFVGDGYETSSDVICFTLFELAWHQDLQDKLRQEIREHLQQSGGELTYNTVSALQYLDMVVSESLRLHPPALLITRVCTKPYTFPPATPDSTAVEVPVGTPVSVAVYGLHMDPQHFPSPHQFDPQRFSPDAVAARDKYTYLPFGEGPRMCIGIKFGQLQVKAALISLLAKFRVKPSPKSSYPVGIDPKVWIKRPLNGAWIYFEKI